MKYKDYLWISHSAISAFERCPQSYYYQYQYRDPKTGNRIQIVSPYFSLGLSVHKVLEDLVLVPIEEREKISLKDNFNKVWSDYSGKMGGFVSQKQEKEFKKRGEKMIERVISTDFLKRPSTQIKGGLPSIDLIPEKNIKLVGSLDWIEILPDNSLHIIDFKTGKSKEKNDSLQLAIYNILAKEKLDKKVAKFSYWYLEKENKLTSKKMKLTDDLIESIKTKALEIKESVDGNNYPCHYNGSCFACGDFKKIFNGEAEFLKTEQGKDHYYVINEDNLVQKIVDNQVFNPKEEKIFELRMEGKSIEDIKKELNLTDEEINKITGFIKKKMVAEFSSKELKVLIEKKLK